MGRLDDVDLSLKLSRKEQDRLLALHGTRLAQLRLTLGGLIGAGKLGPPLCVLFEGWDASGKGGAIKRLVAPLDARHVRVKSFAAPTPDEKRHHYLHRFVPALPGWGGMAVLDRTWYGRVLVERVEGFATEEQWRRAYREIDDFERMLADDGMIIVKLFLHISDGRAAQALRAPPQGSAEDVEAHRRGLAQPREAPGLRGRARGDVRAHRHRARAVADRPGRVQALRARARDAARSSPPSRRAARASDFPLPAPLEPVTD